jgi:hypothetical protein
MSVITLSSMLDPGTLRLDAFESQYRVRVQPQNTAWGGAWDELLHFALYGQGADVSEIGSTWLSSFIDMEAIRPYRWAAVEQRLVQMLSQLWSDLADNPQLDLEDEIDRRVAALGENLEHTILATW